jgi:hypothetical protein
VVTKRYENIDYWNNQLKALTDFRDQAYKTLTDQRLMTGMWGFIPTPAEVQNELNQQLNLLKTFNSQINTLVSRGLDKKIAAQWAAAGPDAVGNLVTGLQSATSTQLKALNTTYGQIGTWASTISTTAAQNYYGLGISTVQSYIKGIQSQSKAASAAVTKLVNTALAAAKKALKIASPSRVYLELGNLTIEGYINGIIAQTRATVAAITDLYGTMAAVPGPALAPTTITTPTVAPGVTATPYAPVTNVRVYIGDRDITDIVRLVTSTEDENNARVLLTGQRG